MLLLVFTYMNASFCSVNNAPSSTILINWHMKEECGTLLVTHLFDTLLRGWSFALHQIEYC